MSPCLNTVRPDSSSWSIAGLPEEEPAAAPNIEMKYTRTLCAFVVAFGSTFRVLFVAGARVAQESWTSLNPGTHSMPVLRGVQGYPTHSIFGRMVAQIS